MARTRSASSSLTTSLNPLRVHVVAEERLAAGPLALAARGGDLVPGALGDDLPLELGEGEQDVEHQPAHRVAVLNCWVTETKETWCCSKVCIIRAKSSSDAAEAVDLVDHHAVDLARPRCRPGGAAGPGGPCCRR